MKSFWMVKRMILSMLVLTALGGCGGPTRAEVPAYAPPVVALVNGRLIDGTGAKPVEHAVVLIQDGRILAAGPASQVAVLEGAQVIDLEGCSILPGFINAHVHDAFDAERLAAWAAAGVTTVRDMGVLSYQDTDSYFEKRANEFQKIEYARLIAPGHMLTVTGGYGTGFIASADEIEAVVNHELDNGADFIKISMEDGYAGKSNLPKFTEEELNRVIQAAHNRGVKVSAHVTTSRYLDMVVQAGVDEAAHTVWDYLPERTIESMIRQDMYMVPTLTVFDAYGALSGAMTATKKFADAGGKLAFGNDYTLVPQNGFDHFDLGMPIYEVGLLSEAGLTPMEIIVSATKNSAHVCGLDKDLGTLEAGKLADVLVVKGNPLEDLQALLNVRMVFHTGVIIRDVP